MATTPTLPTSVPTEHAEQVALVTAARAHEGRYPALRLLHAIPNGGHRAKAVAGKLRAEGVRAGVPDLCLPVARGGYHGLYVEMKRRGTAGRLSPEQTAWIEALSREGYLAVVCRGADAALAVLLDYLRAAAGPPTPAAPAGQPV